MGKTICFHYSIWFHFLEIEMLPHSLYVLLLLSCLLHVVSGIAGEEAVPNQFPWMVRLLIRCEDFKKTFYCGGALISPRVVLTAFHCSCMFLYGNENFYHKKSTVLALLGAHDLSVPSTYKTEKAIDFIFPSSPKPWSKKLEEMGKTQRDRHDIAMYILEKPTTYSETIKPICLPSPHGNYGGKSAVMAGWGKTEESRKQSSILKKVEKIVNEPVVDSMFPLLYNQMSTKVSKKGATCSGDSGGPLMYKSPTHYTIIGTLNGITNIGKCTKQIDNPLPFSSRFNDVSKWIDWILSKLDELGEKIDEDACKTSKHPYEESGETLENDDKYDYENADYSGIRKDYTLSLPYYHNL